jgi:hypothetical protein
VLAAAILHRYPPASWTDKLLGWIGILTPRVGFLVIALCSAWRRRGDADTGAVLLERGRTQGLQGLWGVFFLACSLALVGLILWRLPSPGRDGNRVIEAVFWAWIAFVWAIQSLQAGAAQTRLTERGVQIGARLHPWDRIESWAWKEGVGRVLILTLKKGPGVIWGRAKLSLAVQADQQVPVERVCAEHCPATKIAPTRETNGGQP